MEPEPDLHAFADSLINTFPGRDDAPLALALLDQLANGRPVSSTALAPAAARKHSEVTDALERWPNVQLDAARRWKLADGRVISPRWPTLSMGAPPRSWRPIPARRCWRWGPS